MKSICKIMALLLMLLGNTSIFAQDSPQSKCQEYGFVYGTVDFAKCVQSESKREQCNKEKKSDFISCWMRCFAKPGSYAGQCNEPCNQQSAQQFAQCMAS